ncbi:MAG: hypothetical protein ACRD3N_15735 [Terracidiphilus sp.]
MHLLLCLALATGVCLAIPAHAQQQRTANLAPNVQPQPSVVTVSPDSADSVFQLRRMRALNTERQKEMVSDTDKLLKLIAELNTEVSQTKSDSFTPDQLRELARIEKLARSVKEKMSNPVQTSIFDDNFPPAGAPQVSIPY